MSQTMHLPLPGSHFISLQRAIAMTGLYRNQKENILAPAFQNTNTLPICETFHRSDIDTILAKPSCHALRIYLGMDESLQVRLILVPVNEQGQDILPLLNAPKDGDDDDIVEEGQRCPTICPPESPLNR